MDNDLKHAGNVVKHTHSGTLLVMNWPSQILDLSIIRFRFIYNTKGNIVKTERKPQQSDNTI